jgi:TPR repeat protein
MRLPDLKPWLGLLALSYAGLAGAGGDGVRSPLPAAPVPGVAASMPVETSWADQEKDLTAKALSGQTWAAYNLGLGYQQGRAGKPDPSRAEKWYLEAARHDFAPAQANLAYIYDNGLVGPRDTAKALEWYTKAARQGHPYAQYYVGKKYQTGSGTVPDPNLARQFLLKAAEQGVVQAYYSLGLLESAGVFAPSNHSAARQWFTKAAEHRYAPAIHALGFQHQEGLGGPVDAAKAAEWYQKAALLGYVDALYNMALLREQGLGGARDWSAAVKLYQEAAEQGHAPAQYNLGLCYYEGRGALENLAEAYKWWELAARQGLKEAITSRDLLAKSLRYDLKGKEIIANGQTLLTNFIVKPVASRWDDPQPFVSDLAKEFVVKRQASGFFLSVDGFLLTSRLAVASGKQFRVVTDAGQFKASLVKPELLNDKSNPYALLKVEGVFQPLPLLHSRESKAGTAGHLLGHYASGAASTPTITLASTPTKLVGLLGPQSDPRYFTLDRAVPEPYQGSVLMNESGLAIAFHFPGAEEPARMTPSRITLHHVMKAEYLVTLLQNVPGLSLNSDAKAPTPGAPMGALMLSRTRASVGLVQVAD